MTRIATFKMNGSSFDTTSALLHFAKTHVKPVFPFLREWFNEELFISVETSGSTGVPKILQIKKEYMVNSALATGTYFNVEDGTKALLCLSPDYIAGKMMLVRALVLGWDLEVVSPISNPLSKTSKTFDFVAMVPLQLQSSLQDLDRVKQVIVGGGVVSNDLKNALQKVSAKVYATYGMTETISHIAVKQLNYVHNTPVFYEALPNVSIFKDQRECLVVQAPHLSDAIVFTNDVVALVSEAQFEWLGRYDNIINSGGVKLQPEKIENKLAVLITERFFVAGIPDSILGERLVLIIESNRKNYFKAALKEQGLALGLNKFEIPKEVYVIKQFVETNTKKIQRQKTLDLIMNYRN